MTFEEFIKKWSHKGGAISSDEFYSGNLPIEAYGTGDLEREKLTWEETINLSEFLI
jgi:hypothetical protein